MARSQQGAYPRGQCLGWRGKRLEGAYHTPPLGPKVVVQLHVDVLADGDVDALYGQCQLLLEEGQVHVVCGLPSATSGLQERMKRTGEGASIVNAQRGQKSRCYAGDINPVLCYPKRCELAQCRKMRERSVKQHEGA